jgi:hypothetical protein
LCNVAYAQMAQVVIGAVGQNRQANATQSAALAAQQDAYAGLHAQQLQLNQNTTDQMVARSRDAMREAGTLQAIFADSGLSGNSQERIAAVQQQDAAADQTTLERNRQNKITQSEAEGSAIAARTQSTINAARRPSLVGTGLQIGVIGMEEYRRTNPRTTT